MAKTKNLPSSKYRYNKSSESKKKRLIKKILPWFFVVLVGLIAFIFLFPELLKILPFESLIVLAEFSENVSLALKGFFVTIFTNTVVLISIAGLVILLILIKFLPFYPVDDANSQTQKKLFMPYYRKIGIIIVSSATNDSTNVSSVNSYANRVHQAFISCLSMKKRERMLAVYKHNTGVSLFFPVATKGWLKNKVEEKLERDIVFVSNSIETHYDCRIKTLTGEQARSMIKTLNQMKSRSKIEFSRELITKFNLTDQMYNILIRNEIKDSCFIIRTAKRRKDAKQVSFNLLLLAEDKKTESFILNASGLGKKKRRMLPPTKAFNKLVFSPVRNRYSVDIDDISTLVHIPHTYRGGSLPTQSKDLSTDISNFVQDKESIIVGRVVDEEDIGREISLNINDLLLNVEVFGQIGRGKTKTVSSIVGQLLDKNISTLIFDIKGEYSKIFCDNPNVEIFTIGRPHPFTINIFHTIDEDDIHNTLLVVEEMLASSNQEFTSAMKNLFENALLLTHKSPKRNLQVFVENIYKVSSQLQAHTNVTYLQQTIDAVLNRLNFIFNPINFEILGSTKTTLDLSILDEGKSIILDLSQFQARAARPSDIFLVCNLILKMLYRHASAKEMTNKLRYVVVLEEAINIIPNFYHTESSASLITAENNFLLGRTLGIGHITVSQLYGSVSNIVHGNSATKFIFRSSEKTDLIAKALNLEEEEISKIQSLPTQHCFVLSENSTSAIQIRTLDLTNNPISYAEYQSKMLKKYGRSAFPLLYTNFIDMRTAIYQQGNQNKFGKDNRRSTSKIAEYPQENLDHFLEKEEAEVKAIEKPGYAIEQDTLDLITSAGILPENLICERLCPEEGNKKTCLKYNMAAKIIKSTIVNECSTEEISKLLNDEEELESMVSAISVKKNLEYNYFLVFCTVKALVLDFASENILTANEAYTILTRFAPRLHETVQT